MLVLIFLAFVCGCSQTGNNEGSGGVIRRIFGPSPNELVEMLESDDPDLRRTAIEKLSKHDWGRRGSYLKAYSILCEDPDATVRSAAVRAIGRSGDVNYAKVVIKALGDRESTVRWDAAVALDSISVPEAAEPLAARASSDISSDVRTAAVRALRHYRRLDVLETLLRCLNDPKLNVRLKAAESLTELTGETAGTDSRAWRRILAEKKDPFQHPAEPKKKSWLDWFSRRKEKKTGTNR